MILDHTGISREDSYAFGDSANDIDMIKYVKYGVAMEFCTRIIRNRTISDSKS